MSLIPKEIEGHYLQVKESERLTDPRGELERLRTQAILARSLPRPPAAVFDVGRCRRSLRFPAGQARIPGALDRSGEPSFTASESLCGHLRHQPGLHPIGPRSPLGCSRWNCRCSSSAGAVVPFGRVCRPSASAAGSFPHPQGARGPIGGRGVPIRVADRRAVEWFFGGDADFRKIVAADLASGQHRNPANHPQYFTTAYFHRPEDLAERLGRSDSAAESVGVFCLKLSESLQCKAPVPISWPWPTALLDNTIRAKSWIGRAR